ncbi:MAG: XisI protein [Trichodesmium sp. MAG_R01]|nr:XisI protein [Trichodesmium sp. MAG_R01]
MERERYRKLIKSILEKHSEGDNKDGEIETKIAFDLVRDRYLMFHVGCSGERRVFGCVINVEIRSGKFWIQGDGTEAGIANELIAAGVPKSDTVLGYRSPYMRKFTGFATG